MQNFGVTGARVSAVERPVVEIRASQVREMEAAAAKYRLNMGPHPAIRDRMSLAEAFHNLRNGQLDPNDPESPIRFARPSEIGYALDEYPELAGRPLMVLDDRIERPVIMDMSGAPDHASMQLEEEQSYRQQRAQHSDGPDIYVEPAEPPRVFVHDVEPGFDPRQLEQEPPPMRRGGDEQFDLRMDREPAPMPRGRREVMDEPRMPRGPSIYDQMEQPIGFDRNEMRVAPPQEGRARRVDGRGPAPQGEDTKIKVGRVNLSAADIKEIVDIADKSQIDPRVAMKSLRAPTSSERLLARGTLPFMKRDAEARERIVVIDPKDNGPPVIVDLPALKPSATNLWSGLLHGVSLFPGLGPMAQSVLGLGTAIVGLGATLTGLFGPLSKQEHNLNLMRTGMKHALWGVANGIVDFQSGGTAWIFRAGLSAAAMAQDGVQYWKSRKPSTEARGLMADKKPNLYQRLTGGLDFVANGIATALKK